MLTAIKLELVPLNICRFSRVGSNSRWKLRRFHRGHAVTPNSERPSSPSAEGTPVSRSFRFRAKSRKGHFVSAASVNEPRFPKLAITPKMELRPRRDETFHLVLSFHCLRLPLSAKNSFPCPTIHSFAALATTRKKFRALRPETALAAALPRKTVGDIRCGDRQRTGEGNRETGIA